MILKYISIPELNFSSSLTIGIEKIKKLSLYDKCFTIFWLLGPLILLIERDPADAWLTAISIAFIYKSIKTNNWSWANQLWFKLAIGLWLISLLSAILSLDKIISFHNAFVWFRFPLFAIAIQTWIAKDRDIRVIMLISTLICMLLICVILALEIYIEPKSRLTWPYGDTMTGAYLSKVSLLVYCVFFAIIANRANWITAIYSLIVIITIGFSIMIGERVSLLIRLCSSVFALFSWKPKVINILLIVVANISIIAILLYGNNISYDGHLNIPPNKAERFITNFTSELPIKLSNLDNNNTHWGAWRGGIQQGFEEPWIGIGPSLTRSTCSKLNPNNFNWLPGKNSCSNHPHNFYIQLLAETGIPGLLIGSSMMLCIMLTCFKVRKSNPDCPMMSTAFIIPLALFFPLQQFGNFYGQWGNIFIWFSIGFALSQSQDYKNKTD